MVVFFVDALLESILVIFFYHYKLNKRSNEIIFTTNTTFKLERNPTVHFSLPPIVTTFKAQCTSSQCTTENPHLIPLQIPHAISCNLTMASQPSAVVLPVSTSKTAPTDDSQPPAATPAVRAFINHITGTVRSGLSDRRPWSELVDRTTFSKPESITDATTRVRKNYAYFRVNYFTVVAVVIGISLLTNPFSLVTLLGLLSAWIFLYLFRPTDPPMVILGRTFSERETLGLLIVLSVIVIFLTSVGTILISATLIGTGIVCAHGAFRAPEDLFLEEQEPGGGSAGFLSLLGGAASNAAASAVPVLAPPTRA